MLLKAEAPIQRIISFIRIKKNLTLNKDED